MDQAAELRKLRDGLKELTDLVSAVHSEVSDLGTTVSHMEFELQQVRELLESWEAGGPEGPA